MDVVERLNSSACNYSERARRMRGEVGGVVWTRGPAQQIKERTVRRNSYAFTALSTRSFPPSLYIYSTTYINAFRQTLATLLRALGRVLNLHVELLARGREVRLQRAYDIAQTPKSA